MIPNPDVYGVAETWQGAFNASGINSETGRLLKAGKIKVPTWKQEHPDWTFASSQLRAALDDLKLEHNQPIDNTICAVGQGDKSPYKQIAVYNYRNNEWQTPIINQIDTPINCFPFESYINTSNGAAGTFCAGNINLSEPDNIRLHVWAPNSTIAVSYNTNGNYYIAPFTDYQLKSIILQIQVGYTTNTTIPPTSAAGLNEVSWTYLENWKTSYNQYPIVACRVRAIECLSYNDVNEALSYYHYTGENNNPYRQAFGLGINHPIYYNDNDYFINYALYNLSQLDSIVYLFYTNYNIFGNGQNDYCTLPMYDRFSEHCYHPNNQAVFYKIPYSDEVYEELMQAVASLGFCFTPTSKTEFGVAFTDSDMCIPVINDDGVTTGEYTRGTDNVNNDLYDADSTRDKNYDPTKPVDHNTYSNVTNFNSLSSSAAMTRRYVLNAANVEKLGNDLWTICNDLATGGDFEYFDGKLKNEFLTTNPIDSIVSLQRFPFSIPHTFAPSKTAVRLGKTDGSAQGYLTNNPFNSIVFKGIDIFARFGNCFLDYEPFTSYELYVPFCGTTKIRAADILGHKLNITMQIDLMTGNCTAYIMADQLVIETLNGSCGVDMQLSGLQTATVAANLYNGILGQQQAKSNMLAQGASALLPSSWVNPVGYAAKGEQAETTYKQATYAIEHTETPVHSIGSASALLAWVQEFDARLIIYYPEGDVISSAIPPSFRNSALAAFGHLKGFATVDPGKVSNYQMVGKAAFLQGDILAENIPCTQSERNKIKAFFAEGVYLPPIS